MMTLDQFKALLDSYGGRIERWPTLTRQDALDLLAHSAAARAALEDAQQLDDAIARAGEAHDSRSWPPGEAATALARLRARVATRIAAGDLPPNRWRTKPGWPWATMFLRPLQFGWGRLLTGGVLAIAAGLVVGLLYTSSPPPANVLLLLEPTPLQIFSDLPR